MSEFLKCDAPGCDHREAVDTITASMVGKPCPKCGSNLLTQEDFAFFDKIMRPGFEILAGMGLDIRAGEETPAEQKAAFNYHAGEIHIRLPKAAS